MDDTETTVLVRRNVDGSIRFVRVPSDPVVRLEVARERAADLDVDIDLEQEREAWECSARRFDT